jgi:WD40 repeat protein
VYGLTWSPGGEKFASSGANTVTIWETRTGKQLDVWDLSTLFIPGLAWSPDGNRLATLSYEGEGVIWDVATGAKLLELPTHRFTECLSWSPQGDLLGTCYPPDGVGRMQVTLWDPQTGEPVRTVEGLYGLAWSPIGDLIASVSDSGTVYLGDDYTLVLWDPGTGRVIRRFELDFFPHSFSWSPDGNAIVVVGDKHHSLFVLDARTGEILHTLKGHADSVTGPDWSPRGDVIASGSADGTLIIWGVDAD